MKIGFYKDAYSSSFKIQVLVQFELVCGTKRQLFRDAFEVVNGKSEKEMKLTAIRRIAKQSIPELLYYLERAIQSGKMDVLENGEYKRRRINEDWRIE